MSIILSAKNLTKTYPGNKYRSLINFNLNVEKGQITALLGESGCGKTTALRIIAGFESAEKGEVIINNRVMANDRLFTEPNDRGVGIVFQDYALFPHKTVWKNIVFGLNKLSKSEQQSVAEKVLSLTGLKGYEQRYPHQLSGGQRQRVALARALAPNPGVLLMDEPFSNIDSMKKNQIREEIREILKAAGTTVVFVTHDTKDVLAIADRVAVMKEGVLMQEGTPKEIFNHPANEYIAHFFGKTNVFQGNADENGKVASEIGVFNLPEGKDFGENVSISVRPNSFLVHTTERRGTVQVLVKKRIFMGEYTELICSIQSGSEAGMDLFVHVSSDFQATNDHLWLEVEEKNAWLMDLH
ncbi:ABC transporter ATP-binding protein [Natronoflexus pectinivorans]|uniref:Iron(III) transport system ATP-binding protein n=1 Tax=Natronoflexus pectinivorans TaxID=682526 RepID=A0A4R2G8I0_9BACT|nr:ABC transporter ATP-binding protein [Natronoflexus pectinivorans]TCO04066.1 iron(III) transport system ATP-binding protein [Natronoflexus pectinivorans]